jgi:bifunctional DNA-binding transcriptional regulator/antitoxin component of YhaV-PrlF toxin-antitoxin module
MKMLSSSKVSPILRVTIPKVVAQQLDVKDGEFVIYYLDEKSGEVILRKG